jgi:hypothetical protein
MRWSRCLGACDDSQSAQADFAATLGSPPRCDFTRQPRWYTSPYLRVGPPGMGAPQTGQNAASVSATAWPFGQKRVPDG